jgi:hypothetical protein
LAAARAKSTNSIELVRCIRCDANKIPRISGRRNGQIPETHRILSKARSRSLTLKSARWASTSLEPRMTTSVARAHARESQLELTTLVPLEKSGRNAFAMRAQCAAKSPRILSSEARGTGTDQNEREFSPVGRSDRREARVKLTSFAVTHFRADSWRSDEPSVGVQDRGKNEADFGLRSLISSHPPRAMHWTPRAGALDTQGGCPGLCCLALSGQEPNAQHQNWRFGLVWSLG